MMRRIGHPLHSLGAKPTPPCKGRSSRDCLPLAYRHASRWLPLGAAVALTVLFGPLGLLKRGHDVEMNPGTVITAFVDQTTEVQAP